MIDAGSDLMLEPRAAGAWLRSTLGPAAHLTQDSRAITPGDGFVACPGRSSDGRDYITSALARGAAALVIHASANEPMPTSIPVPWRRVPALADRQGELAAAFYGDPSTRMDVVAVTGTNGKTSCANWIASGLAGRGGTAAIGTLGLRRYGTVDEVAADAATVDTTGLASLTTPDAVSMQRDLASLRDEGVVCVAVEASSIGLDQHRLAGTAIDVAVFTNLSRDHLDYHHTMADYARAKQRLFARDDLRVAIVNGDDPAAVQMLDAIAVGRSSTRSIAYGFEPDRYAPGAQEKLAITGFETRASGSVLSLTGTLGSATVELQLVGRFNALNAAAVCASWLALGLSFSDAMDRLAVLRPVDGRLQAVEVAGTPGPLVVVDYAHTPEALAAALDALAEPCAARGGVLWCVFGCGGDRDAGKRPLMAAACEARAGRLVLTSDNPRSESPLAIIAAMQTGLTRAPWLVEADRAQAITAAVLAADPRDIVLIAGKGHEATQEIAGRRYPFSDQRVARQALQTRGQADHA